MRSFLVSRYTLRDTEKIQHIKVKGESKILKAITIGNEVIIFAQSSKEWREERNFLLVPTGKEIFKYTAEYSKIDFNYLDTLKLGNDHKHLYELKLKRKVSNEYKIHS